MALDNIAGFGMKPKDPKDYTVIAIGISGLKGQHGLTLTEAIHARDALPSGTAVIVRTTEIFGNKVFNE